MSRYAAVEKKCQFKGKVSFGWQLGRGYVVGNATARAVKPCVVDTTKRNRTVAMCQGMPEAERIARLLNQGYEDNDAD